MFVTVYSLCWTWVRGRGRVWVRKSVLYGHFRHRGHRHHLESVSVYVIILGDVRLITYLVSPLLGAVSTTALPEFEALKL